jgi:hypothetical protein
MVRPHFPWTSGVQQVTTAAVATAGVSGGLHMFQHKMMRAGWYLDWVRRLNRAPWITSNLPEVPASRKRR